MVQKESHSLKTARQFLGKKIKIEIDRPLGSKHPTYNFIYPINYGYVKGIDVPDGEDLDVYLLGIPKAVSEFEGVCIAIIHREDDDDDKLIVVPEGTKHVSDQKILKETHFQEQWFDSCVVRE